MTQDVEMKTKTETEIEMEMKGSSELGNSNSTSVVTPIREYCLKQSTSEAEMLLVQNLGSFDPEREFIDKVLKYKELLPADTKVLEYCLIQGYILDHLLIDTEVLEYCLKQSTSEAEMLLVENLGSFDPEREFIDKVLKYKELLPVDVIDMAFSQRDLQVQSSKHVQSQDANTTDIHSRRSNLESRSGWD